MSTSLLYRAFGIRGYEYRAARYIDGQVVFELRPSPGSLRCPVCRSLRVMQSGTCERIFRHIPIGSKPLNLLVEIPRVECHECGTVRQVRLGFAEPRVSYTRAFERYVFDLSRRMTMQDLVEHLLVGWDTVKDIVKRNLERRFKKPRLHKLRRIAIDEISIGHGHRYLTVVLDLATGAIVFVGEGKGAEALDPFWKRLRASHARVKAVAIDMSKAYIKAVSRNLPKAAIVFDRFHVVKLFNEKLSNFRRKLYRTATEAHKKILKGTRWLLLKLPDNLDERRDEPRRLREALEINEPLATAYYMKEELRLFWDQRSKAAARAFLKDWCARADVSGIEVLAKFAKTLREHEYGLLAWYDFEISTGPLEGTNNKIKTLQRRAYGYRDQEFFKLLIYNLHNKRYELVG